MLRERGLVRDGGCRGFAGFLYSRMVWTFKEQKTRSLTAIESGLAAPNPYGTHFLGFIIVALICHKEFRFGASLVGFLW